MSRRHTRPVPPTHAYDIQIPDPPHPPPYAHSDTLLLVLQEARDIALASKKSEHLRQQAEADLEAARAELASCQLVVDESSEAARLREQVKKCARVSPGRHTVFRVSADGGELHFLGPDTARVESAGFSTWEIG